MAIRENNTDNNAVSAADRSARALEQYRLNLARGSDDETLGSGLRRPGGTSHTVSKTKKEQEKQAKENMKFARKIAQLEQQIAALDRQIDALNKQIDKLDREYEENLDRLTKIRGQQHAITNYLNDIDAGGKVELDENGHLKNKAAEQALEDYERRTGKKIDRNNPDAVVLALQEQERYDDQQGAGIEQRNRDNRGERGKTVEERDRTVEERDSKRDEKQKAEQDLTQMDGGASHEELKRMVSRQTSAETVDAAVELGSRREVVRAYEAKGITDHSKQEVLGDLFAGAPDAGAEFSKAANPEPESTRQLAIEQTSHLSVAPKL